MTVVDLLDKLNELYSKGYGQSKILIVNRFSIPENERANTISTDALAEVEQELEEVEGNNYDREYVILLGKIDG